MAEILIRGLDEKVNLILEEKAKKKAISKNEYIKEIINSFVDSDGFLEMEERYNNLIKETIVPVISKNQEVMENLLDALE